MLRTREVYVIGKNHIHYGYDIPINLPDTYYYAATDVHSYKNNRIRKSTADNQYYTPGSEQPIGDKRFFTFYQLRNQQHNYPQVSYGAFASYQNRQMNQLIRNIKELEDQYAKIVYTKLKEKYKAMGVRGNPKTNYPTLQEALRMLLLSDTTFNMEPPEFDLLWSWNGSDDLSGIKLTPYIRNLNINMASQSGYNELMDWLYNNAGSIEDKMIRSLVPKLRKFLNEQGFSDMEPNIPQNILLEVVEDTLLSNKQIGGWVSQIWAGISNTKLTNGDTTNFRSSDPDFMYYGIPLEYKEHITNFNIMSRDTYSNISLSQYINDKVLNDLYFGNADYMWRFNINLSILGLDSLITKLGAIVAMKNEYDNWEKSDIWNIEQILNKILVMAALQLKYTRGGAEAPIFISYLNNRWEVKLLSEMLEENGVMLGTKSDPFHFINQLDTNDLYQSLVDVRRVQLWYSMR